MREFMYLMDLLMYDKEIPKEIKAGTLKRVLDWIELGGTETDEYVANQYRYLMLVKENLNA